MERIKTYWLGIPIIECDGNVIKLETRKAVALLAYLSFSFPSPLSRENLATLFWSEYDQQHANANLRRSLFSINRDLGPDFIIGNRETIMINPSCLLWQDVREFRLLLTSEKLHNQAGSVCEEYINNLEKTIALYRGSFLEGLNLRDSPEFDKWQDLQREGFLQDLTSSLEQLALAHVSLGEWKKAIQMARHWVSLDHLNENAQRTLIELFEQSGQHSAALHQFEEYSRVLNDELGQSFDDKMKEFYQEIRTGVLRKRDAFPGIPAPAPSAEPRKLPLIKTKLFIPRLCKDYVTRTLLLEKLSRGSKKALTLVSAPAGYGKTTLLAEWINSLQKVDAPVSWAICWFSLDAGDNDPMRFLSYLTAALEKVDLELSAETQEIIRSSEDIYPNEPLAMLLNDLQDQDQSVLLVLDDYQFINNPAIHDGITFLLEHLPENVHVVIATRSDPPIPLSRLRACGQLSEIREEDLRFTIVEATRFLNQVFELDLSMDQVKKLENRTEGWVAGLQLAAVSMQGRQDIPKFIDAFSGSHRFIMDYLAEEALSQQPLEIQQYLLQTSILERLNDSLCEFVLNDQAENNIPDSHFRHETSLTADKNNTRLARLENLGLFIVPQDDERIWYRYHHLFADLLRTRLQSTSLELVPKLHQRASIWFEKHGDVEGSINHSLAAKDWENASRLIGLHIPGYLEKGQMTTILQWLEQFPQEELFKSPKLCIQVAELYSQGGMIDQIDPLLNKAEELVSFKKSNGKSQDRFQRNNLSAEEITVIRSMAPILRGLKAVCSGQPQLAMNITQAALQCIPEMDSKELAVLFWVQGWAQRSIGNLDLALELLTKGTEYANKSGATLRDIWTDLGNVTSLVGKLTQAIHILENSLQATNNNDIQNQGNLSRSESALSFLYYERNQLDQAFMYAKRALAHTQWWPSHNIIATANVSLAQIMLARNDLNGSLRALEKAEEERKNRIMTPHVHSLVDVTWVQVWLKQKNWDLLDQWENTQISILESQSISSEKINEYLELRLIMLVRLWIQRTKLDKEKERYKASLSLLERLETSSRNNGRANSLTVILLYKAIVLFNNERRNEAFRELDSCFTLAEPGEYMRIFLDIGESSQGLITSYLQQSDVVYKKYALRILNEFSNSQLVEKHKEALPETLTSREMDILQLLVEGCSNREMAERLVLSEGTIKFHVHNILGKLYAASRTQAIANARELNLI
ncbi:MAG: BTAD domain-containing putative transcriptional regulator [Anaerolineaceae bacterium]